MNKNSKSIYQTEYSLSFQWSKIENKPNALFLNNKTQNIRSNQTFMKNNERIYRHRLKQILLKRLEKMEAEFINQRQHNVSLTNSIKSERRKLESVEKKPKEIKTKCHKSSDEDFYSELRRSRSMALEFKQKNESTQLWWWNEDLDSSSSDFETNSFTIKRSPTISVPVDKSKHKASYIPHSFIVPKTNTVDNSQSTNSKSSISAQIAQTTGYQSTTDDFSSFNHDNDAKSNDVNENNGKVCHSQHNLLSKSLNIPTLKLGVENENDSEDDCNHICFYEAYQKEDFVIDTTSSDSSLDVALKSETYRLD